MKVDHESELKRKEMSMLRCHRWMSGFNLDDNKKNREFRELLGQKPASL